MSVTVLAPTPALPPIRRRSMWEKIFGNFKMGKPEDNMIASERPGPGSPRMSKTRLASISTGVDTAKISYKRNASVAMAKESRSCSAPLPQPPSPSRSRATSIASLKSRRSSRARRASWWRSANPQTDESIPAVPAIDRKYSIFGSHNPDVEVEAESDPSSPTTTRRLSYVPRNAASSFLKTTTPLSSEEKADVIRRASMADMRSANSAAVANKSPAKSRRPAHLNLRNNTSNDSTADHGMFSMAGVCEIEEPYEFGLVSPRGGSFFAAPAPRSPFSVVSAPRSPTDTIMEVDVEIIDSAKNSPDLLPVKPISHVAVVELVA